MICSGTSAHRYSARPRCEPFTARRNLLRSGVLLPTLIFAAGRPRAVSLSARAMGTSASGATSPCTSTMNSCSICARSSLSLRCTRQSWLNTSKPLAAYSSGTGTCKPARWRLSKGSPPRSCGLRCAPSKRRRGSSEGGTSRVPSSKPSGLCSINVASPRFSRLALGSMVTVSSRTRCGGSSTTTPLTRTQPPAIKRSASLREHWRSAITRLDRRSPVGSAVVLFMGGFARPVPAGAPHARAASAGPPARSARAHRHRPRATSYPDCRRAAPASRRPLWPRASGGAP